MLRAERAECFWFVLPLVTFFGTLAVNEVNKLICEINLLGQEGPYSKCMESTPLIFN